MRPSREEQPTPRYRRYRSTGDTNSIRIAIVFAVSLVIVVAALLVTNTYTPNSAPEATETADSNSQTINRPGGSSDSDIADPLSQDGTGSSSVKSGSGSPNDSISTSPSGVDNGSFSIKTDDDQLASVSSRQTTETVNADCSIHGRVTDDWGASMVGVRVFATTISGTVNSSVTDIRGRYTLSGSAPDAVNVSVALAHGTDNGDSFAVMVGDDIISLSAPIDPESSGCEVNFDSWNVQEHMVASPITAKLWPDAAAIYQYTLNAESLALSLSADFDNSSTLQVQAWCEDPNLGCDVAQDGAYFIAENELGEISPPTIVMLPSRSSAQSSGVPDNREYHEYGHYFLSVKTGDNFELPAGDINHGGYYNNSTTRDSFVEGFAEFYSMMVSRHIDGDHNAEIYTIGADYDLETDRLPWEGAGWWEEFTVAGLLLDLVDDDSHYAANGSELSGVNILTVTTDAEPSGTVISGSIVNNSPLVVRDADVTVDYLNEAGDVVGTQVTRVLPKVIAPTREGTFYAAPPAGLDVVQATATLGGVVKSDDDQMAIDLLRLVRLITEYERTDGGIGVSSVAELYDSLTMNDKSQSNTRASLEDISEAQVDEIFVNHGFFADLDGDRMFNPDIDGEIGSSSHPVSEIGGQSFSPFIPRQDPDPYEGSFVRINTGDIDVDAIIQISMPADGGSRSYAYIAPKDGANQIELAVPPANQNAAVTIITAGKNYRPVIAFRVDADNFHEMVENGTISDLQVAPVELASGSSLQKPDANSSAIQFGVVIGGLFAVILVVASLIAIRRQWGRA